MFKLIWGNKNKQTFSRYMNLKIASYIAGKSSQNLAIRNNRQMAIFANDYIGIQINQFGYFELEELNDLFGLLKPLKKEFINATALDIGANIGNHTIYFTNIFSLIHSFEPNTTTHEIMKFNTRNLSQVITHNFGLGDENGQFNLSEELTNIGLSSIKLTDNKGSFKNIDVKRLDDIELARDSEICFMKIDVEGFEANVISGAKDTIAANQPLIVFEQHVSEFESGESRSVTLLKELGYKFCWSYRPEASNLWLVRRFSELYEIFFGRNCQFITSDIVPYGNYTMLVAVPHRFQKLLKL